MPDGSVILVEIAREDADPRHARRQAARDRQAGRRTPTARRWARAARSMSATTAASTGSSGPDGRLFRARRPPATRPARSRWSIPRPASSRRCTRAAVGGSSTVPTTWCSTRTAASGSPTSARRASATTTVASSTTPRPTARMIEEKVFPLERPNGLRLVRRREDTLCRGDSDRALLGLRALRARRDQGRQRTLSRREGPGDRRPGRLPDVRFAGHRRFGRPHLRRHPDHRRGVRHLARRQAGDAVQAARSHGHQRLLRRPRACAPPSPRCRLTGKLVQLRMAAARAEAQLPE